MQDERERAVGVRLVGGNGSVRLETDGVSQVPTGVLETPGVCAWGVEA